MFYWIIFIDLSFITIILLISLYFDLRLRKVSNKFLRACFCFSIFLNMIEILFFYRNILFVLILKLIFFFLVFLISLVLFSLKIIGGSDGKLFLLIFSIHPIKYLNCLFVLFFFLFFSLFFLILFFFNLIHNSIKKNSYAFRVYYSLHFKLSIFRKLFMKSFCSFFNLDNLKNFERDKIFVDALFILFNDQKSKLQILAIYRPPLTLICIISYYFIFFLIIVI
jgi:Flp pilus assembly protein protease CpaA